MHTEDLRNPLTFEQELRDLAARYTAEAEHAEQAARECLQWAEELRRHGAKTRVSAGD